MLPDALTVPETRSEQLPREPTAEPGSLQRPPLAWPLGSSDSSPVPSPSPCWRPTPPVHPHPHQELSRQGHILRAAGARPHHAPSHTPKLPNTQGDQVPTLLAPFGVSGAPHTQLAPQPHQGLTHRWDLSHCCPLLCHPPRGGHHSLKGWAQAIEKASCCPRATEASHGSTLRMGHLPLLVGSCWEHLVTPEATSGSWWRWGKSRGRVPQGLDAV